MKNLENIKILFVAGFGPIVKNREPSKRLYSDTFGIPFKEEDNGYLHTEELEGVKHFAIWPLYQAVESCFGEETWPADLPIPQAWIEFDVEDIQKATSELESQGYQLLVSAREEPLEQVVTRLLSPEGILVGLTHTPLMREEK